ncbi:hypothetical protein F4778DRAFT_725225 [Xylariomycetidae sp. FL2044]|nr:hypothetical protein F4778DRAFT_725225 [Xylariomycetidae sp. FL2044]
MCVKNYLPASWTVPFRKVPAIAENAGETIGNLLAGIKPHHSQNIVVRHDEATDAGPESEPKLHVGIHDEEVHGPATSWEQLDPKEQQLWKDRLKKSGHWVEEMGEAIFKGVLFGEIGGAIGNIVGEAL